MTAIYDGLQFKTKLEAQWAAFFDLAEWEWRVNPAPVDDWSPDFRVTFPCNHSECGGSHTLLVAVLPIDKIEEFKSHPCLRHFYGLQSVAPHEHTSICAGAAFGTSPRATTWQMSHGAGGGTEAVDDWVDHADTLWSRAASLAK